MIPRFGEFCSCSAYHFCLNLPERFSQPGDLFLVQPCTINILLFDESDDTHPAQTSFECHPQIVPDVYEALFCTRQQVSPHAWPFQGCSEGLLLLYYVLSLRHARGQRCQKRQGICMEASKRIDNGRVQQKGHGRRARSPSP